MGWDLYCSAHEKDLEERYPSESQRRRIVEGRVVSDFDGSLSEMLLIPAAAFARGC